MSGIAVQVDEAGAPHAQAPDAEHSRRARIWGERVDISARSVLVTIFGDAIVPLGGQVWLSDLIELAEPFGFSSRLVRTSVSRLAAEDWVQGTRSGRRSRYHLTDFGRAESAQAERRIYYPNPTGWDRRWTLVLIETQSDPLHRLLRWRGFGKVRPGVFARPSPGPEPQPPAQDLTAAIAQVDPDAEPLIATADFADLDGLVDNQLYRASLDIDRAEGAYRRFTTTYSWTADVDLAALAPQDAFALRTMVIHDLRRVRLADPELPGELLRPDWPGHAALGLAAVVYRGVETPAWRHLQTTTGLAADPALPLLADRFPSPTLPNPATRSQQ